MQKTFILIVGLLLTMSLNAKTILIIGDSLSSAHGIDIEKGWVNLLKIKLKEAGKAYRVVNVSVSGSTTSDGVERLPSVLKQYRPNLTLIELGANDGLRGLPIVGIKSNLQEMINLSKKINSQILLIGLRLPPAYGLSYAKKFQQLFSDLAQTNDIELVPLMLDKVDENKSLFQTDGVHPNEEAQAMILENVWPRLEALLSDENKLE